LHVTRARNYYRRARNYYRVRSTDSRSSSSTSGTWLFQALKHPRGDRGLVLKVRQHRRPLSRCISGLDIEPRPRTSTVSGSNRSSPSMTLCACRQRLQSQQAQRGTACTAAPCVAARCVGSRREAAGTEFARKLSLFRGASRALARCAHCRVGRTTCRAPSCAPRARAPSARRRHCVARMATPCAAARCVGSRRETRGRNSLANYLLARARPVRQRAAPTAVRVIPCAAHLELRDRVQQPYAEPRAHARVAAARTPRVNSRRGIAPAAVARCRARHADRCRVAVRCAG
jgi:hypothetical protein